MKTCVKLLVVAAVVGLVATDEVKGPACDIDQPGTTRRDTLQLALPKFGTCFQDVLSDEMNNELKTAKLLDGIRRITSAFCTHAPKIVSCVSTVKASYETCHNKNVSVPVMILADLYEHLLPSACENEGERMAHLIHAWMLAKNMSNDMAPLKQCFTKASSLYDYAEELDLDVFSRMYLMYKNALMIRSCLKNVEDSDYQPVLDWVFNEVLEKLKCEHPEENTLVPCSELEVSKVTTSSICDTKLLNKPNLYDHLEEITIADCTFYFVHDSGDNVNSTSVEQLNEEQVKGLCTFLGDFPHYRLRYSVFSEVCLTQEEDKQFQLFAQSIKDLTDRSCVDEGAWVATVYREMYHDTPEHRNDMRDCYHAGAEARKSHQGHAVSSKNMRFYHEMIAFKQCLVEKLHDKNHLAQGIERMFNDVLQKMKCVSPVDGTAVLCETIHEH